MNLSNGFPEAAVSHRPLVITQNGKAAAVLISPADFDGLM
jgi:prevent-host-death family protein